MERCEFDACDHKWKLALYTNGNEETNSKDHISLYLISVDSNSFDFDQDILVSYNLFVLDQVRDKYLKIQGVSRFHALKSESSFDKFLPLEIFMDPLNGYLLDDTCMFGAEVCYFVKQIRPKSLTITKNMIDATFLYRWKIEKFSELKDEAYYSQKFTGGGYDWELGNSLSLFLALADPSSNLFVGEIVHVTFRLRVVNQVKGLLHKDKASIGGGVRMTKSRNGMGWNQFMPLCNLNESSGYLVNDTCIIYADVDTGNEESIKYLW
ncbi:hypothetical protein AQUCO_00600303v1 [Aquilegia coerulea]|uniref:MATH domain-containing protein n=1 Tax=Aquilegia coerulea TaxID=218851 RepID=A0A2G5ENW9_AQUCA|nr:hypothetical protein AQUCO_00600303v1 [Aquilegia coerulea]